MIETSLHAWAWAFLLFALSTGAAVRLARAVGWSELIVDTQIPVAFAFAVAPFLLGFGIVLSLGLFPGKSHTVHLVVTVTVLALICLTGLRGRGNNKRLRPSCENADILLIVFKFTLALWVIGLVIDTLFLPLTQNDALEYATVGRILFDARSLAAYPALDLQSSSGFYGPWTHPPLYVALIYLANIVQGNIDHPGLMRLIAPWFACATTWLVYALGSTVSRMAGTIGAVLCLSAPLFFLGADASLIDALPVLGFLLIVVCVIATVGTSIRRGTVIGFALGASLWTHSQALLFIPLAVAAIMLWHGSLNWKKAGKESLVALAISVLIGAHPYIRNYMLFGSPISDNPIVFALPALAWTDYFTTGRGLDHWPAIIQYGWFKGWFALEAYGLVFWLALPGLYLCARKKGRDIIARNNSDPMMKGFIMRELIVVMGLLALYALGVVISTLLGMELMIKNERYLLVILPLVAMTAGMGIGEILKRLSRYRAVYIFSASCLAILFLAQIFTLVIYRFKSNGLTVKSVGQPFAETLENRSEYLVVNYLRANTPQNALVLSLKPADMYYSERRMISYLDPRLVPFYREQDPEKALELLRALNVTYIHSPDYGLPPLYNSALQAILRNPAWTQLEYSADGNQIYSLRPSGLKEGTKLNITPRPEMQWQRSTHLVLGGRKNLANIMGDEENFSGVLPSVGGAPLQLFHRDWSTSLTLGSIPVSQKIDASDVSVSHEYGIDITLRGHGLLRFWLLQFDVDGTPLRGDHYRSATKMMIGDLVLGEKYKERTFSRRVDLYPRTASVELIIEHIGTSSIKITDAQFVQFIRN